MSRFGFSDLVNFGIHPFFDISQGGEGDAVYFQRVRPWGVGFNLAAGVKGWRFLEKRDAPNHLVGFLKPSLGGGNSNILYFHPYLGKIPILTNIFQMRWNHQPDHMEHGVFSWKLTYFPPFGTGGIYFRPGTTNSLPLNMDGWKMSVAFWETLFSGAVFVGFREVIVPWRVSFYTKFGAMWCAVWDHGWLGGGSISHGSIFFGTSDFLNLETCSERREGKRVGNNIPDPIFLGLQVLVAWSMMKFMDLNGWKLSWMWNPKVKKNSCNKKIQSGELT